ncbi:MAG TPA: DUF2079 domain-containing protein [Streptosporangiaceae bacterium]|jgi:uncharacterized membrane protein
MSVESAVHTPVTAVRRRYAARLSSGNRAHIAGVGALTTVIAAIYSAYGLVLYATYRDRSYDLVIFDQSVRSYSRFHLGVSIIKGLHDGFSANFSVLGDHFSPIDIALAPLYWIWDGPQTLLVAEPVLFALAIPWIWVFTRRAFGGGGWKATTAAYLVSVAYGLSWPIAAAVAYGYHEVAFAPLLIAIAFERLQAGKLRGGLIALGLLLLVKEDMGLLVAGIGAALAVSFSPWIRRQRLVGVLLILAGVAYTLLATDVLIPAFGGRADYYWAYSALGKNVPQLVLHIIEHPGQFLRTMFVPSVKLLTMEWLLAPFCLLPLLSPLSLAALPLLAERMQGAHHPTWWGTTWQYNAFLVVILVLAAVDGAARLERWVRRFWRYMGAGESSRAVVADADGAGAPARGGPAGVLSLAAVEAEQPAAEALPANTGLTTSSPLEGSRQIPANLVALLCCAAICLAALYTVPKFALGQALHPSFYQQTASSRAAAAADAVVPAGVVVAAANLVGPELSRRDTVLLWDGDGYTPPFAAPWVVADVQRPDVHFGGLAQQRADVTYLRQHGYQVVFERDGYIVLHRPGPPHLTVASQRVTFGPVPPR